MKTTSRFTTRARVLAFAVAAVAAFGAARGEDARPVAVVASDEALEKAVGDALATASLRTAGRVEGADAATLAREATTLAKDAALASRRARELEAKGVAGAIVVGTVEVPEERVTETAASVSVEVRLQVWGGRSGERVLDVVRREKASAAERGRAGTKAREAAVEAATKALAAELPKALAADSPRALTVSIKDLEATARPTHEPGLERAFAAAGLEIAARRYDPATRVLEIDARLGKGTLVEGERRFRAALEGEETGEWLVAIGGSPGSLAFRFRDPHRDVTVPVEGVAPEQEREAGPALATAFASLAGVAQVERAYDAGSRLLTLKLRVRGRLSDLDAAIASAREQPLADLRLVELGAERLRYRLVPPSDKVVLELDGIAVETSSVVRFEQVISGLVRVRSVERSSNAALVQVRFQVAFGGKPAELAAAFEDALTREKDLPPLLPSVAGPGADLSYRRAAGGDSRILLRVDQLPPSLYATAGSKLVDVVAGLPGARVVERTYAPEKERLELVLETPPTGAQLDVLIWKASRAVPELARLAPAESRARVLGYVFLEAVPSDFAVSVLVSRLAPEAFSTDGRQLVEAIRALEGVSKVEAGYDRDARELSVKLRSKVPPHELEDALWTALAGRKFASAFTADRRAGSTIRIAFIDRAGDRSRTFVRLEGAADDTARRAFAKLAEWLRGLEGVSEVEADAAAEGPSLRLWSKRPPVAVYDEIARALADPSLGLAPLVEGRLEANVVVVRVGAGVGGAPGGVGPVGGAPAKLADLVAKLDPSVVLIEIVVQGRVVGHGSGFFVSPRGYVLTNFHVAGAQEGIPQEAWGLRVKTRDGRTFEARFIDGNKNVDAALLKIPGDGFPVARVGDSDAVRAGDSIVVIGNPHEYDHSVTTGIVSGLDREHGWIQTSAFVNPGNSGGPAFDEAGRVVGIAVAQGVNRVAVNEGKDVVTVPRVGIYFLVPINQALPLLQVSGAKAEK